MPTYEYECSHCGLVKEILHSMHDKPQIKCSNCGSFCRKIITSFYLGGTSCPSEIEMKKDLSDNHGIEQIRLLNGTFKNFYKGVKKDSNRIKEEMKKNQESYKQPKKSLSEKEARKRATILKEQKAETAFKKRKITI